MTKCAMPATYKAAILKKHGAALEMVDVPSRECAYGEVCVKIKKSGVCHTDLHVQDGDWEVKSKIPIIPGHEGVGVVVCHGQGVTEVAIGERVCLPWLREACGCCTECIEGWETTCPKVTNAGFTADGAFAQYVYAPAKYLGKVPSGLSDEQAAPITCAGVTVYKALKESHVRAGQFVAIVGAAGGLGHVAVQYAHAMGMRVVAIDFGQEKAAYLKTLGCSVVIDTKFTANLAEKVNHETNGGCHGAIILVPLASAVADAVRYMRPRGVIVPIALPPGDFNASTLLVVVKALRIQGSIVGTRQDLQESLDLAAMGKVKCKIEVRPFSQVNQCMDDLRAGKVTGRLVLDLE